MPSVAGQRIAPRKLGRRHVAVPYRRQLNQIGKVDVVLVVIDKPADAGLNVEFDMVRAAAGRSNLLRHVCEFGACACRFLLMGIEQRNQPLSCQ